MNRSICLTAVLMVAVSAVTFHDLVSEEWRLYKLQHKKNYKSDTEDKFRMKIYMENRRKVAEHNVKYERGLVSFKLELNKLADMLPREFSSTYNGYRRDTPPKNGVKPEGASYIAATNVELPGEVDWRNQGAVTPVKDQGNCRSCWAFSATGSLEGQFYRKTGKLVSLSEQNLIDCSSKNGNGGCEGGMMDYAFEYIKENGGIDTEDSYPYEAEDDNCRFNASSVGASDKGFVDIPRGDEGSLQNAVATKGPVSVAIDASHDSFQLYKEGVYYEPDCSTNSLDHGVLVVGYGTTEEGEDYWLVKNSWGANWGDHGYIKMARNRNNNCGIASTASFPLV